MLLPPVLSPLFAPTEEDSDKLKCWRSVIGHYGPNVSGLHDMAACYVQVWCKTYRIPSLSGHLSSSGESVAPIKDIYTALKSPIDTLASASSAPGRRFSLNHASLPPNVVFCGRGQARPGSSAPVNDEDPV